MATSLESGLYARFCHVFLVLICFYTETSCDDGIVYNWTCYKIHRDPVNWFTAVNRCLAINGSLAVFDDQILSYFASTLLIDGNALWIGLIKSWWTWPDAGMNYWLPVLKRALKTSVFSTKLYIQSFIITLPLLILYVCVNCINSIKLVNRYINCKKVKK